MDVLPPIEQEPAGDGERRPGWRRVTGELARRLRSRLWSRPSPSLASLVVGAALAVAVFWPSWQAPTSRLVGSGRGDGALMTWFLG
jgi:hypothetical protein